MINKKTDIVSLIKLQNHFENLVDEFPDSKKVKILKNMSLSPVKEISII